MGNRLAMHNLFNRRPTLKDLAGFAFGGIAVGLFAAVIVGSVHSHPFSEIK
jgi:hypothetical protein